MSPSLDPKRRNQCIDCSKDIIIDTSPSWRLEGSLPQAYNIDNYKDPSEGSSKQTQDWENRFEELGFGNQAVIRGTKRVELKDFLREAFSSQLEEVEEWAKKNKIENIFSSKMRMGAKHYAYGCNKILNDLLSKLEEMKKRNGGER